MKLTKIHTYSFADDTGVPYLGSVYLYAHGTTTPVNGYDVDGNILPYPVPLDSRGSAEIYVADSVDADAYVYDENHVLAKTIEHIGIQGTSQGGVSQEYVDEHDSATLQLAKTYTDEAISGISPSVTKTKVDSLKDISLSGEYGEFESFMLDYSIPAGKAFTGQLMLVSLKNSAGLAFEMKVLAGTDTIISGYFTRPTGNFGNTMVIPISYYNDSDAAKTYSIQFRGTFDTQDLRTCIRGFTV